MDRILMSMCLSCLVVVPLAGNAQHVYKCVKGLDVSYQSIPCDDGKQLVKQWDAAPEPAPSDEQIALQRKVQAQGRRESAYLRALARRASTGKARPAATAVAISAARDGDSCAKAKKRRDDAERKLGLKRTFEDMRRLSTMVYEACR